MGVVAVGDSVTAACWRQAGSVPCRTWAEWVADSLGEPLTVHATAGATSTGVLADMPTGRYDLALAYFGINDVIRRWSERRFAENTAQIVDGLTAVADRVLVMCLPVTLGRRWQVWLPRRVESANRILSGSGALVGQVPPMRGREMVWPDGLHQTSVGSLQMAEAALDTLAGEGVKVRRPLSR